MNSPPTRRPSKLINSLQNVSKNSAVSAADISMSICHTMRFVHTFADGVLGGNSNLALCLCLARLGSADRRLAGPLTEVDLPCRRSEWHGSF
jgi:hypothetical protein